MKYKTLHRKLKMTTNDITNQINITIYLLQYLIKLRGLYLINHVSAYALATGGGGGYYPRGLIVHQQRYRTSNKTLDIKFSIIYA